MIILLSILLWLVCGVISIYLTGLFEKLFNDFISDGEQWIFVLGPFALVALFFIFLIYITPKIKSLGKGVDK